MKEKFYNWQESFGLADIDKKEPSRYLQSLAEAHIEGLITLKEAEDLLNEYYQGNENSDNYIQDKIMLRIAILLNNDSFELSPNYFTAIHKYIFDGTRYNPGIYRTKNIRKNEPILDNHTVIYAPHHMIIPNLTYDFAEQQKKRIIKSNPEETIKMILPFISNIWQTHPFNDGNTRTTSIFLEKYLKNIGYQTDNSIFKENSIYFRNALVRNNYEETRKIEPTSEFLYKFFYKVLIDPYIKLDTEEQKISITRQ